MIRKLATLAIAGVLLFSALFPVRLGVALVDDVRIDQAHAAAPAIVLPILGAVALGSGVFLGGVTSSSYNANLSEMYDYIENFLQTNYDASAETQLLSLLTPFNGVDLGIMSAQMKNAIASYVTQGLANGTIASGTTSAEANTSKFVIGNASFNLLGSPNDEYIKLVELGSSIPVWEQVVSFEYYEYSSEYTYIFRTKPSGSFTLDSYSGSVYGLNWYGGYFVLNKRKDNGRYSYYDQTSSGTVYSDNYVGNYNYKSYLNASYSWPGTISGNTVNGTTAIENYGAIVNQAILDNIDSIQGVYDQFVPTASQLQEGISQADLVEALEVQAGTAQNTLAGVNALIGQFSALLNRIGTIGDVIGNIGEDVASIPSVLDDVLEGVLAFPNALSTGLAGVVSAVNAIPASIAGVLEGVTFPIQFPTLPEYDYTGTVQLPVGAWDSFQLSIRDKAPFCYLPRMVSAFSAWWNMANVRSFYFDVPLPDGSGQSYIQRFDAEDLLSVEYGSTDVATIIRTMVTISLCFALIYAAVNIAIWSVKGA